MSIIFGKLAIYFSKLLGNRGTDIGGKVALKFNSKIFIKLSRNIENIILVTGTNGKTTTTNIIASVINEIDDTYLHNKEGANMYTGILTTLIKNYKLIGNNKIEYAIFEVDEGSVPRVLAQLDSAYLVINNFFRDQLDRYGEIDIIIDKIKASIDETKIKVIINSDDPFCMRFDNEEAVGFGLSSNVDVFKEGSVSDSRFCPVCGKELTYTKNIYGQLGHYYCDCGFKRKEPKYEINEIRQHVTTINNIEYKHNLTGYYNAYNIGAAISLLKEFNIEDDVINYGLMMYHSDDGRMQLFHIDGKKVYLNLVKNPAGMNMTLQEVKSLPVKHICFILNDNYPDGRDVSWIWDADFEELLSSQITKFYVSGIRAYDMALRLKNIGISVNDIVINNSFETLIDTIIKEDVLIVSSYTALNDTKMLLVKKVS